VEVTFLKVEIDARYPNTSSNNLADHTAFCLIRLKPETIEEAHKLDLLSTISQQYELKPDKFEKHVSTYMFDYIVAFEVKQE
jgi:hypothetical protein